MLKQKVIDNPTINVEMRSIAQFLKCITCGFNVLSCAVLVTFIIFVCGNLFLLTKIDDTSRNVLSPDKSSLNQWKTESSQDIELADNPITPSTALWNEYVQTLLPKENGTKKQLYETIPDGVNGSLALLIIACNRPSVRRCLNKVFQYKPSDVKIPIIVSQDCGHSLTDKVIQSYRKNLTHIKQPDLGDVKVPPNMQREMFKGYYKISRHYKWALTQVFDRYHADSVIILEDDIEIAPDFFDYFIALRPLLDKDPSVYCISAWNDNGKTEFVDTSSLDLLYRSDFFPGLGWMMTRKLWNELKREWPLGFWDDWIRAPKQRNGRVCIRPELSRTKTFGKIGVSQGQFYDQYLKFTFLNSIPFPFRDYEYNYLLKENYDDEFLASVYNTLEVNIEELDDIESSSAHVLYDDNYQFVALAKALGIMSDLKAGVPRTAYKGVVTFFRNNKRFYLAPSKRWEGYLAS